MPVTLPACRSPRPPSCCKPRTASSTSFPEVASVFGKAGRAQLRTDPAPLEMTETVINLKPEQRVAPRHDRSRSFRPRWTRPCVSLVSATPGRCRSRRASICSPPASARRSASKCSAPTLRNPERPRTEARAPPSNPCPATTSAFAERLRGGLLCRDHYPDRACSRALRPLRSADFYTSSRPRIGGTVLTTTVEGPRTLWRHPRATRGIFVTIRRPWPGQVLVPTMSGAHDPAWPGGPHPP